MKRTTILLPDDLAALLDRERHRRDVSAAAIVREALEAYLIGSPQPRRLAFIGIGRSGATESIAENMEELLAEEARSEEGFNRMMFGTPTRPEPAEATRSDAGALPSMPSTEDHGAQAK